MSKRNMVWLVIVVVVGIVVGIIAGWLWAVVAAAAVLVVSELVERARRRRVRAAQGIEGSPSVRSAITQRRRK